MSITREDYKYVHNTLSKPLNKIREIRDIEKPKWLLSEQMIKDIFSEKPKIEIINNSTEKGLNILLPTMNNSNETWFYKKVWDKTYSTYNTYFDNNTKTIMKNIRFPIMDNIYLLVFRDTLINTNRHYRKGERYYNRSRYGLIRWINEGKTKTVHLNIKGDNISTIKILWPDDYLLQLSLLGYNREYNLKKLGTKDADEKQHTSVAFAWGIISNNTIIELLSPISEPVILDRDLITTTEIEIIKEPIENYISEPVIYIKKKETSQI